MRELIAPLLVETLVLCWAVTLWPFSSLFFNWSPQKKRKPPLDISDKVIPAEVCFAFSCMLGVAAKHLCEACNLKVLLKSSLTKKK